MLPQVKGTNRFVLVATSARWVGPLSRAGANRRILHVALYSLYTHQTMQYHFSRITVWSTACVPCAERAEQVGCTVRRVSIQAGVYRAAQLFTPLADDGLAMFLCVVTYERYIELAVTGDRTCHSSLLIHSWWNVPRLARMLPPSHPPYRRSDGLPGAWILTWCGITA